MESDRPGYVAPVLKVGQNRVLICVLQTVFTVYKRFNKV